MRKNKLLPGFTNVGVGNRSILQAPMGEIYHAMKFTLQRDVGAGLVTMTVANQLTDIQSVQVKLNDNVIQDWKPADLQKVNATSGAQFAARDGFLTLWFSRPDRRTMEGEEGEGWGTSDLQNFTIEVLFSTVAQSAGLVGVSIVANAIVDSAPNRPLRSAPIRHIRRLSFSPAAAGVAQLDKIVKGVNIFYARIHFMSALVTSVKVSVDDRIIWADVPRALLSEQMADFQLVLAANTYTIPFDLSHQVTDQLATFYPAQGTLPAAPVQDLRVDVTASGAGTFDVILEQYRYLS